MTNREIDIAIATHVMGWKRYDDPNSDFLPDQGWIADIAKYGVCPHFCIDPAASKQLRDKMRAEGWRISLFWPYVDRSPRWHCCIQRTKDPLGDDSFHGDADTEEMAVALAALNSLGQGGRQNAAAGNPE